MATFAVTYTYADATAAGRDEHRPRHVEFLKSQYDGGRLVTSGPFGPGETPGALLIVKGDSKTDVEALMNQDPFYINNLVEMRNIRQWNIVFGAEPAGADAANAGRN